MLDDLLPEIEHLRAEGAVVLLKWDGMRQRNRCTVVITRHDTDYIWRHDSDDIVAALMTGISSYLERHQ